MRTVCQPPITEILCDCAATDYDAPTLASFLVAGTELVNGMLDANYGACPETLRPCGNNCSCIHDYAPVPTADGMSVLNVNCSSRRGTCMCDNLDRLDIGLWSSWRISNIDVDGAPMAATDYWVENNRWLVRRTGTWPVCQDLSITNPLDPGYFGIDLEWGPSVVPELVKQAISEATCRLLSDCLERECGCEGQCAEDNDKRRLLMYSLKDIWPFTDVIIAHKNKAVVRFGSRPKLVSRL